MTVKELINQLTELPPDAPVILAGDPEGNYFYKVSNVELCRYEDGNTWIYELTYNARQQGFSEEDCNPAAPPAVCLWPA